jgi:NTP pyrophosphatase (non-canonical NTP hydrolase)
MHIHEFQSQAMRTAKELPRQVALLHLVSLLADEVGELSSAIKKAEVYGQPYDFNNIEEEIGDLLFAVAYAAQIFGMSLETCARKNNEKLAKRYPLGHYTDEHAAQRLDKAHESSDDDSGAV